MVVAPKILLRLPAASSPLSEMASGSHFRPVITSLSAGTKSPAEVRPYLNVAIRVNLTMTSIIIQSVEAYRVTQKVSDLGSIDMDLGCSIILLGQ